MKQHKTKSNHILIPKQIDALPDFCDCKDAAGDVVYAMQNDIGHIFLYVSKSSHGQWLVWYRQGGFWSSFGKTMKSAIDGAIEDAWIDA